MILVANSLDCVARPAQEYVLVLAAISMARLRGEDGQSETGIRAVAEFATNIEYAGEPSCYGAVWCEGPTGRV